MEVGQIIHNNPVGATTPDFVDALVAAIRKELSRVYWNVNQKLWAGSPDYDPWDPELKDCTYEPLPLGIEWRPYYNWGGAPEDPDWDQSKADAPNFSFEGIEIRWYKRFGRSMNVNVVWEPAKWVRWFERCLQTIRAYEDRERPDYRDPTPFPDPAGKVPLEPSQDDFRYVELNEQLRTAKAQITCIACVCIDISAGKVPRFERDDWRWCHELEWVTKLGMHALTAPAKFRLHEDD